MTQEIEVVNNTGVAELNSVTFSEQLNALVGREYTSFAGNTYFNSLRLVDDILVKEDIGDGYAFRFLNGLHIYNLRTHELICERFYHCLVYSRESARILTEQILAEHVQSSAEKDSVIVNFDDIKQRIAEIVMRAFFGDQLKEFQQSINLLANAALHA